MPRLFHKDQDCKIDALLEGFVFPGIKLGIQFKNVRANIFYRN